MVIILGSLPTTSNNMIKQCTAPTSCLVDTLTQALELHPPKEVSNSVGWLLPPPHSTRNNTGVDSNSRFRVVDTTAGDEQRQHELAVGACVNGLIYAMPRLYDPEMIAFFVFFYSRL